MARRVRRRGGLLGLTAGLAILAGSIVACGDDTPSPSPTADEIDRAVEQLGDARYSVRQQASRRLWQAGNAAVPALQKACSSSDAEVVRRASQVLENLRWEIYPDTPPATIEAVNLFRFGDAECKRQACQLLVEQGDDGRLFRLIGAEPDKSLRESLFNNFRSRIDQAVPSMLVLGNFDAAAELLRSSPVEDHMRDYAALLLVRGKLDGAIDLLQGQLKRQPDAVAHLRLAYLLRAKGDLAGAIDAATKVGNEALLNHLLQEHGDWPELVRRTVAERPAEGSMAAKNVGWLGYLATYHRLSGNAAEFDRAVAKIVEHARKMPNDSYWRYADVALLVNERFDDAVELTAPRDGVRAFQILCMQGRFREAFRRAGFDDTPPATIEAVRNCLPKDATSGGKEFRLGCEAARVLHRLGEKERALDLAGQLAALATGAKRWDLVSSLCECEADLNLSDRAFEHAALIPSPRGRDVDWLLSLVLPKLFNEPTAQVWWLALRDEFPNDDEAATLQRLRGLLTKPLAKSAVEELRRLADRVEKRPLTTKESSQLRARYLLSLSSFYARHGLHELAVASAEKAAANANEARPAANWAGPTIQLGDLFADAGRWAEAACAYQDACTEYPRDVLALYLLGHANVRLGKVAEGRRQMEIASALPLRNATLRCQLVKALQQRNLEEEALRQCELAVKSGEPYTHPYAVGECLNALGDAADRRGDYLAAADCWEKAILQRLTIGGGANVAEYLKASFLIHKARARGLLKSGKGDDALEELHKAEAILPPDTQIVLDLVPEFQRAGRQAEADALFHRAVAVQETICRDFPRSASHHNDLARLGACLDRELNKALEHAQRAVELEPEKTAYLDTLAEVQFRRGNPVEAIRHAKHCLELEPNNAYLRKQLERFANSKDGQ